MKTNFTIYAADATGAQLSSGGTTFKVAVRGQATVKESIKDQGDGTYLVELTYPQSGKYEVSISHNFQPIKGSPFTVNVQAARRPPPPPPPRLALPATGDAGVSAQRLLEWDTPVHNGGMPIIAYKLWELSRDLSGGEPTLLAEVGGDQFRHEIPMSDGVRLSTMCVHSEAAV